MRLTMAQALLRFLAAQSVERDGTERRFFHGCLGIFGHGNVAGIGEALFESPDLMTYFPFRNEQGMVHAAAGFARMRNRLGTLVCTSSVGPGATNMVTGAALATINRLPVLLLPGDVFAGRAPDPVLQQLEVPWRGDASVNDCFQPVSRYWDRISRPEQLLTAAMSAMRVLTNQAETGAVTLALPQDVQAEAYDYPEEFFEQRVWRIDRPLPDRDAVTAAADLLRSSARPLIVAGGGVIYSEATAALARLVERTGIPVAETQAGKGSLAYDNPLCAGAIGATGNFAANRLAADADLVLGIGTRWSDFTTASKTAFKDPGVRFINLNVADFDAHKHAGLALVGDARAAIEVLDQALDGWMVPEGHRTAAISLSAEWDAEVSRLYRLGREPVPAQSEVLGAVNDASAPTDVVVCAAGSMPGDLHKLWRTRDPKGYHVEYGYSCMGYEIAGGLGVKMADPSREVWVMVGDGSFLMLSQEIVTSIQEGYKLSIVLVDNQGYSSIGALSRSLGTAGFGTRLSRRSDGEIPDDRAGATGAPALGLDLGAAAAGMGAHVIQAHGIAALRIALATAKTIDRTVVVVTSADRYESVPGYESWWDVPVAEVSGVDTVAAARRSYESVKKERRGYF